MWFIYNMHEYKFGKGCKLFMQKLICDCLMLLLLKFIFVGKDGRS